ncbi:MAG TPA: adenylate/guanylate cyclase domain-containing protein [Actinomycetota bacterium]|nr:adenylate/guanylate cyclase domain-containing protein [Actinomycetota bacterium]
MVTCATCGTPNDDSARFCVSCGTSLVPACPVCGEEVPSGARFCPSCGSELEPEPVPAGQDRRLVTILFTDVTGSTGLGERLDPERLQELMATYFGAMREEIEAEGGTVEKFIGDAVMAAFGVPVAHEDDPARALRAALRMQARLERVNANIRERFDVELRIRTGVNTGEVLAATNPQPGEAMATGDAVNVAARLEQTAEPGQVVVAERTARAARGFRFRELEAAELRGKSQPVPIVLLLGEAPSAPERGVPGLQAPMVGRDQELELLRTVYRVAADERRPNLVTIFGEPGVGKSRLTHEFTRWVEEADPPARVLRGRCLPYGEGVTYWPLAEILKGFAGIFDSDPTDVVLEKIRSAAERVITRDVHEDPARATAALTWTLGIEDPDRPATQIDPRRARDDAHAAWRSFLSALSSEQPLVVVVEDIHWADPVLLDLLDSLAERVLGPALLLCPARPELAERRPGWGGGRRNVSTISLEPLSDTDARQLIRLLLTVEELPAEVRQRILDRAGGNPFFLEEIVRHLIDDGLIARDGDRWRAAPGIQDIAIPDTVQGVLAARIDLLEPADKRALQRAAVVGRVFWPGPVRRLLNGERSSLEDALARLENRDLILSRLGSSLAGEPEFIFKHVLTRDVAYETLPRRERPGAHATVAAWIEETAGDRREEFIDLLAHHYAEAHRTARELGEVDESLRKSAFEHLVLASRVARLKVALAKAKRLAQQAGDLAEGPLERSIALEALAEALFDDFRGDQAYRTFAQAAELRLASAPEDRSHLAYLFARTVEMPVRWPGIMMHVPPTEEVDRYLDLGFAHLPPGDSEERARLLIARSMRPFSAFGAGYTVDQLQAHLEEAEAAAEMAERLELPLLRSAALDGAAGAALMQGRGSAVNEINERRQLLAPLLDDPGEIGDMYANAAFARVLVGRYREGRELAFKGMEAALAEAPSFGIYSLVFHTVAEFRLGDWDAALSGYERFLELLGDRDDPPRPWLQAFAMAALIADARGDAMTADQHLEPVLRGAEVQSFRTVTGAPWVARLYARRGAFEQSRRWLDGMTLLETAAPAAECRCDVIALEGSWSEAPETVARAREVAAHAGSIALPAYADRLQGRAALAVGEVEGAIDALTAARERFDELEAAWERACTELSLAEALAAAGRRDDARSILDAAAGDLERAGALSEIDRLRAVRGSLG